MTLRDARMLRDALLADDDWDRAGHSMPPHTIATTAPRTLSRIGKLKYFSVHPLRREYAVPKRSRSSRKILPVFFERS
jgi:hypothetical protein